MCLFLGARGAVKGLVVLRQVACEWHSAASAAGRPPDGGFMMPGSGNYPFLSFGMCPITRGPKLYWHSADRCVCHPLRSEDTKRGVLVLWQAPPLNAESRTWSSFPSCFHPKTLIHHLLRTAAVQHDRFFKRDFILIWVVVFNYVPVVHIKVSLSLRRGWWSSFKWMVKVCTMAGWMQIPWTRRKSSSSSRGADEMICCTSWSSLI